MNTCRGWWQWWASGVGWGGGGRQGSLCCEVTHRVCQCWVLHCMRCQGVQSWSTADDLLGGALGTHKRPQGMHACIKSIHGLQQATRQPHTHTSYTTNNDGWCIDVCHGQGSDACDCSHHAPNRVKGKRLTMVCTHWKVRTSHTRSMPDTSAVMSSGV